MSIPLQPSSHRICVHRYDTHNTYRLSRTIHEAKLQNSSKSDSNAGYIVESLTFTEKTLVRVVFSLMSGLHNKHTHTRTHARLHARILSHVCTPTRTHGHTHMRVCTHAQTHSLTQYRRPTSAEDNIIILTRYRGVKTA